MMSAPTDADLEAYLDEALPVAAMSALEDQLRSDEALTARLSAIIGRRDAGVHSLGAVWRSGRLSCPTRQQLGSHLLGAVSPEVADYIAFHLETIGCRYCQANLADLEHQQAEAQSDVQVRRRKYFQSSAGLLKK